MILPQGEWKWIVKAVTDSKLLLVAVQRRPIIRRRPSSFYSPGTIVCLFADDVKVQDNKHGD